MRYINLETWDRAKHYEIFRNNLQPHYSITFNLDITNFLFMIKKKEYSFTFSFIYAVTKCANQIEEFRYRFVDGKPVVFDTINTRFNYLNNKSELYKAISVPMQNSMEEYIMLAKHTVENQNEYFVHAPMENIYQFSSIPWLSFTNISHTDSGNKDDATPVFVWGKYYESDGKLLLPFSVKVHHSFVDGIHIGKFADILQTYLNEL